MGSLANKVVLVTGGGGFIGSALVEHLLEEDPAEIRVFDNDQQRLFKLQRRISDHDTSVQYVLGDLRDEHRVSLSTRGIDAVFHVGAVKHVGLSEYNPIEAVQTNIIGTQNLLSAAIDHDVDSFTAVSTDKASNPSAVMGATKLIMERLVIAANNRCGENVDFNCVRFGNVLGSSGSVVPIFLEQISDGGPITVTNPDMTRFIMPVTRAVELVLDAHYRSPRGGVFVLKMPAFRVGDLAEALRSEYSSDCGYSPTEIEIKHIGRRPGERMHEKLISTDEVERVEELGEMYVIHPDLDVETNVMANTTGNSVTSEYTSAEETPLTREELVAMVKQSRLIEPRSRVKA